MCVPESVQEVFVVVPLWFVILFVVALFAAVFLRSSILSIGVIVLSVVGCVMMYDVTGISEFVRYGMMAVFIGLAGAMVWQLLFSVRRV